ncbi:hypothetical protein Saga11_32610 [Bacillus safensis]|nr:hypothetical protein Saga11_32610 [Bacillus safensis]
MLSYLKPKLSSRELDEYMVQINEQKHKIDQSFHEDKEQIEKMLDFYFYFFKGMHEFRKKQFDEATSSYKFAEKVLLDIKGLHLFLQFL